MGQKTHRPPTNRLFQIWAELLPIKIIIIISLRGNTSFPQKLRNKVCKAKRAIKMPKEIVADDQLSQNEREIIQFSP